MCSSEASPQQPELLHNEAVYFNYQISQPFSSRRSIGRATLGYDNGSDLCRQTTPHVGYLETRTLKALDFRLLNFCPFEREQFSSF